MACVRLFRFQRTLVAMRTHLNAVFDRDIFEVGAAVAALSCLDDARLSKVVFQRCGRSLVRSYPQDMSRRAIMAGIDPSKAFPRRLVVLETRLSHAMGQAV